MLDYYTIFIITALVEPSNVQHFILNVMVKKNVWILFKKLSFKEYLYFQTNKLIVLG